MIAEITYSVLLGDAKLSPAVARDWTLTVSSSMTDSYLRYQVWDLIVQFPEHVNTMTLMER